MLWALGSTLRGRAWVETAVLLLVAYVIGLEVASGITIRGGEPMNLMLALVLVFIGPSLMPRGPLAAFPLARVVVDWPIWTDVALAVIVGILSRRAHARAAALPESSDAVVREDRIELALVFVSVAQGLGACARLLPWLLGVGEV